MKRKDCFYPGISFKYYIYLMKKHYTFLLILIFFAGPLKSQLLENLPGYSIPESRSYAASWIRHPETMDGNFAVVLFRKAFQLSEVPDTFLIHISADNRYRLFVNGIYASKGPAKSDLTHWYYETMNLASLLREGTNVLAAEVVNFGPKRTYSQFSARTDFFVQGHTKTEAVVNTTAGSWKTTLNKAYQPKIIDWIGQKDVAFGLYVANPTDSLNMRQYPWGWEEVDYDDRRWQPSAWSNNAGGRDTQYAGGINFSNGKLLVPRPIRQLTEKIQRFQKVARYERADVPEGFLQGNASLNIPPHQKVSLLIDQTVVSIGYPEMILSGGKDAVLYIGYAETLYEQDRKSKGNRNDLEGKIFIGIRDVFIADGGENRCFRPLSHRAFRFIQLDIQTKDQPLIIHDFYNRATAYPLQLKGSFACNDPSLNELMERGWRTASICAQDILLSDAYYEQMQYLGDSKVHNLALLYLSGNDDLVRNQLKQTDWSRIPEGLTLACYPNPFHLVIPYYSLVWIEMIHDHMMWAGDREFTGQFDLGIHSVMEWYHQRMRQNGLLGPLEWWNDVDWSPGFPNGVPPGIQDGNSTLFSLEYAIALQKAAEISEFIGHAEEAAVYAERSKNIIEAVKKLCYDPSRQLFAETPDFHDYSQHTNLLAILSGAVRGEDACNLMKKILDDKSLHQVALFFRYYLLEALYQTGMMDNFEDQLQPWFDMVDQGLTTFTEVPLDWESQRSDCHPWSTSPNIHFFASVCGIRPLKPGFEEIMIQPNLGPLEQINATFPHPDCKIEINLFKKDLHIHGKIIVEGDKKIVLKWNNQSIFLKEGINLIDL
jgi:alpha-L-rhamnosidase